MPAVQVRRQAAVLAALARQPNISAAGRAAGVNEATVRAWRDRDVAGFRARYEAAIEAGINALEAEAMRRAQDGVPRYVVSHGRIVLGPDGKPLIQLEYSDALMLAMLRAHKPGTYRAGGVVATAEAAVDGAAAVRLRMIIPGVSDDDFPAPRPAGDTG